MATDTSRIGSPRAAKLQLPFRVYWISMSDVSEVWIDLRFRYRLKYWVMLSAITSCKLLATNSLSSISQLILYHSPSSSSTLAFILKFKLETDELRFENFNDSEWFRSARKKEKNANYRASKTRCPSEEAKRSRSVKRQSLGTVPLLSMFWRQQSERDAKNKPGINSGRADRGCKGSKRDRETRKRGIRIERAS